MFLATAATEAADSLLHLLLIAMWKSARLSTAANVIYFSAWKTTSTTSNCSGEDHLLELLTVLENDGFFGLVVPQVDK